MVKGNNQKMFRKNVPYYTPRQFQTKFKEDELAFKTDIYEPSKDKLWSGGTSVDWEIKKVEIKNRFNQAGLGDFLEDEVSEFDEEEPDEEEEVDNAIFRRQRVFSDRLREDLLNIIQQGELDEETEVNIAAVKAAIMEEYPANAARKELLKELTTITKDYNSEMDKLAIKREDLREEMPKKKYQWMQRKEKYEEKLVKCAEMFDKCFGKNVLALIGTELGERRFYDAWEALDAKYSPVAGGNKTSQILNRLIKIKYIPNEMTLDGYCNDVRNMINVIDVAPNELDDSVKVYYLVEGIKRGTNMFDKIISYCDFNRSTFEETIEHLLNEARKMTDKRASEKDYSYLMKKDDKPFKQQLMKNNNTDSKGLNKKPDLREPWMLNLICRICGKKGHVEKICWFKDQNIKKKQALNDKANASNTSNNGFDPVKMFQEAIEEEAPKKGGKNDKKVNFRNKSPDRANCMMMIPSQVRFHEDVKREGMEEFHQEVLHILKN